MATDWVKELVNDVRSLGYQVPIEKGVYRVYWRGKLVRLPNGVPMILHTSPHTDPRERKNAITRLIEAGVLTEDPRVTRQRQSLPTSERQALKEARARVSRMKRKQRIAEREAKVAEKETQFNVRVERLADRLDEAAAVLGSIQHVAALLFDKNPVEFSSLGAAHQWLLTLRRRKVSLTAKGKKRLDLMEKLLDWLHDQNTDRLNEDYKRAESEKRSAAQKRRFAQDVALRAAVKETPAPPPPPSAPPARIEPQANGKPEISGDDVQELVVEVTKLLRWLNTRLGAS